MLPTLRQPSLAALARGNGAPASRRALATVVRQQHVRLQRGNPSFSSSVGTAALLRTRQTHDPSRQLHRNFSAGADAEFNLFTPSEVWGGK